MGCVKVHCMGRYVRSVWRGRHNYTNRSQDMGLCYLPPSLNLLPPIAGPASHRMAIKCIPVKARY